MIQPAAKVERIAALVNEKLLIAKTFPSGYAKYPTHAS
jgi:hypothetical protein